MTDGAQNKFLLLEREESVKICRVCCLRVNNMFLPWGNEIWQGSKCPVIMSLVLSGVPWTFNPFYFPVTQLQRDFLTEQAL